MDCATFITRNKAYTLQKIEAAVEGFITDKSQRRAMITRLYNYLVSHPEIKK